MFLRLVVFKVFKIIISYFYVIVDLKSIVLALLLLVH